MNKHRHHYVPQGYLKGFNIPGNESSKLVWSYVKDQYSKPKPVSTKSIAHEKDYYAQEIDDGIYDYNKLEDAFSDIENIVIPIIARLKEGDNKCVSLNDLERGYLSFFISILLTRGPSFRDGIEDIHSKLASVVLDNVMKSGKVNNLLIKELHDKGLIKAEAKQWVSLKPMLDAANSISMSILNKNWQFFTPPEGSSFITSDSPVVFYGSGPANPSSIIFVNLKKDLSLVCSPLKYAKEYSVSTISEEGLKIINLKFIKSAKKFVFSDCYSDWIAEQVKVNIDSFQGVTC